MLAVVGFGVGLFLASGASSALAPLLGLVYHGGRHDACGDSDDGVAEYHDKAGEQASDEGDGGDVAVADGGEGDDGPVDAGADVGEVGARTTALDDEHQRAEDDNQNDDEEKVNEYLFQTQTDALQEKVPLVDEAEQLEHSEDAYESEGAQNKEIACAGQLGDEGQVERKGGEQVDDAEETERVALGFWGAVEAQQVFDGEEEGQHVLENGQRILEAANDSGTGFNESDQQTEDDGCHDSDVKCLPCWGVGVGHDVVEAWLVLQKFNESFHVAKIRIFVKRRKRKAIKCRISSSFSVTSLLFEPH